MAAVESYGHSACIHPPERQINADWKGIIYDPIKRNLLSYNLCRWAGRLFNGFSSNKGFLRMSYPVRKVRQKIDFEEEKQISIIEENRWENFILKYLSHKPT